jgi:RNA polymerase sigma-70 factor (ECF subfamily)
MDDATLDDATLDDQTLDGGTMVTRFEAHRPRLRAVAQRMLGSPVEAEDAVQEAWIRYSRADVDVVENLGGWLTTVVARIALDMLRTRTSRREELAREPVPIEPDAGVDLAHDAALADTVGAALLVVLDSLRPAERLAFVLHDMFAVPFDEIGGVLGRSPDAAKQLASRARRRVQGSADDAPIVDAGRHREVVAAFLAASRAGDFDALVALLHPDIELRADEGATRMGAPGRLAGAAAVAGMFSGRALGAQPALLDGADGMAWVVGGHAKVVWDLTIVDGVVTGIDMIASPDVLADIDVTALA